jgi:fatty acid/phospholipid biosynthesis enzyme
MSEVAGQNWHDDRPRMRALLRFDEEETKHQQLFQRTEEVLEASCGHSFVGISIPKNSR